MTEEESKKDQDAGKGGDKNAMKAFYRAMYAGAEPDPDDFGIKVNKEEEEQEQGAGARPGASSAEVEHLQQQLDEMEKRCVEAENLYKRMAADFENYRKRVQKEKEEFAAIGIQRAIEALLPALDDMDLAVTKLTADIDPKNIIESLNMVYKRFARCLEQIGIKQLDVIGEQFDPRLHEPVQQIVNNDVPEGSIVHQLRPGYQFNDKILRPSLVNVATGGSEPEPKEEEMVEEIVEEIVEEVVEGEEGTEEIVEEIIEEVEEEEAPAEQEESVEEIASEESSGEEEKPSEDNSNKTEISEIPEENLTATQDIPADMLQSELKKGASKDSKEEK